MKIEVTGNPSFKLIWDSFDGDDCFNIHYAEVTDNGKIIEYDFGPCAVKMYRKVVSFFEDEKSNEVGLGFRNPDIIYYDILRKNGKFEFIVDLNEQNKKYKYCLNGNLTEIDMSFINEYYG